MTQISIFYEFKLINNVDILLFHNQIQDAPHHLKLRKCGGGGDCLPLEKHGNTPLYKTYRPPDNATPA
jgi:hypothetical protein